MAVSGTYDVMLQTPMGPQKATLVLAEEGGSLSGFLKTPMGDTPFEGGTIDGDNLSWVAKAKGPMGRPMKIACTATIDGDAISGKAKLGMLGTATFSGQRA
jgi:hypothetical protein